MNIAGATALYALLIAILLGVVSTSHGPFTRWLSTPLLVLIGRVSYGIYLVHVLCLNAVERLAKPGHGVWMAVTAYALTLLVSAMVAYLLFRAVERPLIKVGRRLSKKLKAETLATRNAQLDQESFDRGKPSW